MIMGNESGVIYTGSSRRKDRTKLLGDLEYLGLV